MNEYRQNFVPAMSKIGSIILLVELVIFFCPFLGLWFLYGVQPEWGYMMKALIPWMVMNIPWWFSYIISYFPILGAPGTMLCFLSGNIANMRIPAAASGQKASGVKAGTDEGMLIMIIGISISVYVNLVILGIGVIAGAAILEALPPTILSALDYLLPALFGAVFAMFMKGQLPYAAVAMGSALIMTVAYNAGIFSVIPFDTSIAVMIVPIVVTVAYAFVVVQKQVKSGMFDKPAEEAPTDDTAN